MRNLPSPFGLRSPFGGGVDTLSRYAIEEGGIRYRPLFVWDANAQQAWKRDFELQDYAVIESSVAYSPLFVWDAHNQVAIK